jgi:parvulin-like peptidyl-prolyl isomerase
MTEKNKKNSTRETSSIEKKSEKKNESSIPVQRELAIPRQYVIAAVIIIAVLAIGGFMFGKWFTVAKVNGESISRTEYTKELEKAAGKQVLDSLTTKKIIMQEAKKRNITVTQADTDAELKKIENQLKGQGQSLDQVLAFQGQTRDSLKEQIVLQKTVEKMVGKVTVSDEEVDKFIEENKDLAGQNTDLDTLKKQAKDRLTQQKTDAKIQQLIQDLRKKAKIEIMNE